MPTHMPAEFLPEEFLHTFTMEDERTCGKVLPIHTAWLVLELELILGHYVFPVSSLSLLIDLHHHPGLGPCVWVFVLFQG